MYDIEIHMTNQPGQPAVMGKALSAEGISIEGGGMFLLNGVGIAHFLVHHSTPGLGLAACRKLLAQRLDQNTPGPLGALWCDGHRRALITTADGTSTEPFDSMDWALTLTVAVIWGSSFLWIAIGRLALGAAALELFPPARSAVPDELWPDERSCSRSSNRASDRRPPGCSAHPRHSWSRTIGIAITCNTPADCISLDSSSASLV